jgi:hypothetical protein
MYKAAILNTVILFNTSDGSEEFEYVPDGRYYIPMADSDPFNILINNLLSVAVPLGLLIVVILYFGLRKSRHHKVEKSNLISYSESKITPTIEAETKENSHMAIADLQDLNEMKKQGLLTEEEFETLKKRRLGIN